MAIVRKRRVIDDAGAEAVIEAAVERARQNRSRVVIAVVDPSGELVALRRTEDAQVASSRVAVDKARTAAIFVRPSRELEEQVSGGRLGALALHSAAALIGGIPLTVDGEVVGAIGTSGETPDEDRELALIGVAAAQAAAEQNGRRNGASFFSSSDLYAKFAEGGILLDAGAFKLDAGRRVQPREVEYHEHAVDVMHVVQGRATVVTGGELIEPREVGPGELRAAQAEGGTPHELAEGDVLAIPNGVPHQFVDVSDPFLYFVVKVEA